jgi:hypothetical protein
MDHAKARIDDQAGMAALLAPIPSGRRLGKKLQAWRAELLSRMLSLAPDLGRTDWYTKTYSQKSRTLHLVVCRGREVARITVSNVTRADAAKVTAQVEREQGIAFRRVQ